MEVRLCTIFNKLVAKGMIEQCVNILKISAKGQLGQNDLFRISVCMLSRLTDLDPWHMLDDTDYHLKISIKKANMVCLNWQ